MKTLNKTLLALLATSAVSVGANAALFNNHAAGTAGQAYVGVKAGQFNIDAGGDGFSNDKPTAYGVYGGYQFDPSIGAEVEYIGSNKVDDKYNGTKVGTLKAETLGAYGTYKYNFPTTPVYGKAKLGIAKSKAKNEGAFDGYSYNVSASKTSVAGGLGLGYNISPQVAIEAEYAFQPKVEDVKTDLWTIGAHLKF